MSGTLYIVATPIGNLADFSERGKVSLQQVDIIACEDTRHSRHLLDSIGVRKPLIALHQHNEQGSAQQLIMRILAGESVAVISDAGTPVVSDPGAVITRLAHENGITVVPIPGASAVMTALSASGLAGDQFIFAGFIPAKAGERQRFLGEYGASPLTTIFYETPHRIAATLDEMAQLFSPERILVIARELSKTYEQIVRLPVSEAPEWLVSDPNHGKGEFVLLLAGEEAPQTDDNWRAMADDLAASGVSSKDTAGLVAKYTGAKKKAVYQYLIDSERNF